MIDGSRDPIAKRVLTEDGLALGSIADIDFDSETGAIRQLILADEHIAGSRLMGTGTFAVVVSSMHRASTDGDLAGLSKTELYEIAKSTDIDGRSTTTKDELIEAIG